MEDYVKNKSILLSLSPFGTHYFGIHYSQSVTHNLAIKAPKRREEAETEAGAAVGYNWSSSYRLDYNSVICSDTIRERAEAGL